MSLPKVTLITVNYRQTELTCKLLESIKINSYPNLETIVVDNGAVTESSSIFKLYLPTAQIISSRENLGFAGGNNLGIKQSTGEVLFFINNDTVLTDGLVEALVLRFKISDNVGGVSPKIKYFDSKEFVQYAGFTEVNSWTGRNETIGKNQLDSDIFNIPHQTPYLHGAAMMIKREVIEKVGLMHEEYFLYYEELDWCSHIRRSGYALWYEPKGLIYHKESASVGKMSPLKIYYETRGRLLFMKRNFSALQFNFFKLFFYFISMPSKLLEFIVKSQFYLTMPYLNAALGKKLN